MTSDRSNTARILLERVPDETRSQIIRDVARSLSERSGSGDISLVTALLDLHHDEEASSALLDYLCVLVDRGDSSLALSACSDYARISARVLSNVIDNICFVAAASKPEPGKISSATERDAGVRRSSDNTFDRKLEGATNDTSKAVRRVEFVAKAPELIPEDRIDELLTAALLCLSNTDKSLASASRDLLFALLSRASGHISKNGELIWSTIQGLVDFGDVSQKTLGFSVWLRWIASTADSNSAILQQQRYWGLLVEGLRTGDSERRKACLQVLRASVDRCARDPDLLPVIAAKPHLSTATPEAVRKQYVRFCTIFETIVLGRYLNQVQECEADLDFLSSPSSVVQPIWLYVLLSSALAQKMQDANRKFIGKWILRAKIRTDDPDAYLHFFRHAFLPWATSGNLFTSTLRISEDTLRSEHGETLSKYIEKLLMTSPDIATVTTDLILDSILSRHGNNFAYAMAYLVLGIRRAYESIRDVGITARQLEQIAKIPTWAGLPEVARDLIIAMSWRMCHKYSGVNLDAPEEITTPGKNWERLCEKVDKQRAGASAHVDGNIASLSVDQSRRDKFEQDTIAKCVSVTAKLDQEHLGSDVDFAEAIEDIWGDLEYLEYPKSLLAVLPQLIPHRRLVEIAKQADGTDKRIAELLSSKTLELLELSKSRSYILSPLVLSVRQVALDKSEVVELFSLADFIINLAEHPPTPTIDAQLEDATIPLLQALDPCLERLDYQYYFGPRESQGFAALLDIVSRLSAMHKDLHQVILARLLERWTRQKTPPPTVSPWKTTLQLQVMLLCADQHLCQSSIETARKLLKDIYHMLALEPLPRYRYLFEWMISRACIHHPELRQTIFDELRTKDHHSNPKFLASLMKLGVNMAKTESSDEKFAQALANAFVPLAASSKVVIRHEAQWQIPVLMDHAKSRGWTSVSGDVAFIELDEFIRSLSHFDDPPLERQVDKLDPINDHNLTHLVEGSWWRLDNVERPQASHADFLKLYSVDEEAGRELPRSCMPLGQPTLHASQPQLAQPVDHERTISQNIDNISRALGSGPGPAALQTKGNAYLQSARVRHDNLLVVASLVDNPYNLGGLSRVSEIFGAGAMYLQNTHVTSNKDFTNVSVSSHMHLPILPLSAKDVEEFVAEKKRNEGFKVVGIEQTDRSVMVGSPGCVLPEKCILVMGSEREGIPAPLLTECDLLVEIPQVGITRSLNVQTAAAIVLCEYAKQWKKSS